MFETITDANISSVGIIEKFQILMMHPDVVRHRAHHMNSTISVRDSLLGKEEHITHTWFPQWLTILY